MPDSDIHLRPSSQLRRLLAADEIVVAPGVFDGVSAKLVQQASFPAVYASGGAIARSLGLPDLGLLSLDEVTDRLSFIVEAVTIPVIADADTGFGNALNAQRTARAFARAGVAGFHLEDQSFPKRCGHYDDKAIIPIKEMAGKLSAVRDALEDPDMVVIARTDALAIDGLDAAIDRAGAYAEAGADVIFVEAPETLAQVAEIATRLEMPLLINMFKGGKTPMVPLEELQEMGYRIVIIPSDLQRAAIFAMRETLAAIAEGGDSEAVADRLISFAEREAVIGTADYLARDAKYGA